LVWEWSIVSHLSRQRMGRNTDRPLIDPLPSLATGRLHQDWLDGIKGIAILGIVLNHVVEPIWGAMRSGWPSESWGTLSDRLHQLRPITVGFWTLPVNLVRYLGWLGDSGVALFLIASGFGLTWGLLHRSREAIDWRQFLRRRLMRIYPLWWLTHGGFVVSWLVTGWGLSPGDPRTWLSASGLRLLPGMPYYFAPAWWFVPLLLQLYLLYPLLWQALERSNPRLFVLCCCLLSWSLKAIGMTYFLKVGMLWNPGILALVRLPEFALGMVLAVQMKECPDRLHHRLTRPGLLLAGVGLVLGSIAIGLFWLGVTVFSTGMGLGLFLIFYGLLDRLAPIPVLQSLLKTVGQQSYGLFLVHHPIVDRLVPSEGWDRQAGSNLLWLILALGLSWFGAIGLSRLEQWLGWRWSKRLA
jgi:peptidoglycan/LPS O-acetylase OafA/YrhL